MGKYTIKYARPLGEFDSKYGQKYWGRAEESDMDISFNLMNPVNFEEGDEIEYEEKAIKETSKGREYFQLRKVRKSSGSAGGDNAVSASPAIKEGNKQSLSPAADSKYLKDISDYPMRVYTAGLPYIDFQYMMKTPKYLSDYLAYVQRVSAHLLSLSDKARNGELKPATEAPKSKYEFKKDEVEEPEEDWVPTDEDYQG